MPSLKPRQVHANAGGAQDRRAVVADQLAREADQDRRQGGQSRPLRHLPAGRGRGAAADVCGHSVADRPAARGSRASMRNAGSNAAEDDGGGVPR